jgi:hypothetical protein
MKKLALNTSKLKLQKEKISDLNAPKKQKLFGGADIELPTTTVWTHTRTICP